MNEIKKSRWSSSGFCVKVLGKMFRIMTAGGNLQLPVHRSAPEQMLQHTHTHFTYELLFATEGEMTLISERGIESYRNRVVIVPPGFKHCALMNGIGGFNLLVLPQFEIEEFPGLSKLPHSLELEKDTVFYITQLAKEWDAGTQTEATEHLAALVLYRVFGKMMGGESLTASTAASPIGMIEAYINSNYSGNITLNDLSPIVHLCNKQVARIIKREYGMTLSQLLAQKRVGAAEMLLKNSNLKISEIAERVSPGAENYFFVSFKKITGMSPLQYRKNYRSESV